MLFRSGDSHKIKIAPFKLFCLKQNFILAFDEFEKNKTIFSVCKEK